MRRLAILLLLLGACDRPSSSARELARRVEELEKISAKRREMQKELDPLQERFVAAQRKGDKEEMKRVYEEAQPTIARMTPIAEKEQELLKAIHDRADAALKKNPDDVGVLDVRSRVCEGYEPPANDDEGPAELARKLQEDTERLVRLRPGNREYAARRAGVLRRLNRYAEARERLALLLKEDASDARALAEDGLAAYCLDDFESCVRQLEAATRAGVPRVLERDVEGTLKAARERREPWAKEQALRRAQESANLPQVKLVTSQGEVVCELFEDEAPNTVANFVWLADQQFYDGTRFHRILPNFMAQGGDPNSRDDDPRNDGQGGPGHTIPDELEEGKYRRHYRGSLSMAKDRRPNSGGSQFFITHRPTEHLDGLHTVFGRVLSGMDVVDRLKVGDTLTQVVVLRRRDHPYRPTTDK